MSYFFLLFERPFVCSVLIPFFLSVTLSSLLVFLFLSFFLVVLLVLVLLFFLFVFVSFSRLPLYFPASRGLLVSVLP